MKHRKKGTSSFGRTKKHKKAMLNNLARSLIKHNRIKTTHRKAKEVSKIADRLVTLGKKQTVNSRRKAKKIVSHKRLLQKLFDEIAPKFEKRNGGYTRVIKLGFRRGDAAPISIVEFIDEEIDKSDKN